MLKYKVSGKYILKELKARGYSTFVLRNEKLMAQATITQLKTNKIVGNKVLAWICDTLQCQLSDLIVAVDDETGRMHKFTPLVDITDDLQA